MGRGSGETSNAGAVRRQPLADLPVKCLERVAHIGTLRPEDKRSSFDSSWEGHGLSVSIDPDQWEAIAKLGGATWWELENETAKFIDAHSLTNQHRAAIEKWGVDSGYVERSTAYKVSWYDEDLEDEASALFESKEEAEAELEALESDAKPEPVLALRATPLLEERLGMESYLDCFDHLLVIYGEDQTDHGGVWWQDEYGHLSAPRGVIFPSRLDRWQRREISSNEWFSY